MAARPSENIGTAHLGIKVDDRKVDKEMARSEKRIKSRIKPLALAAGGLATAALVGFSVQSIRHLNQVKHSANEVRTMLSGISDKDFAVLRNQVLDLSNELGTDLNIALKGTYQALSAGVPKDNVIDFLRVGAKVAVGGVTDMETAVDGLTNFTNVWGITAEEAGDAMFKTIQLGKLNAEQASRYLGTIMPSAKAYGLTLNETLAMMAAMTTQGVQLSAAVDRTRQLFIEASKGGTELSDVIRDQLGGSFQQLQKDGWDTHEILQAVRDTMTDEQFTNMFSSEEARASALMITGDGYAVVTKNIKAMDDSLGALDEAYGVMDRGRRFEKAMVRINNLFATAAFKILPHVGDALWATIIPAMEWSGKAAMTAAPRIRDMFGWLAKLGPELARGFQIAQRIVTGAGEMSRVFKVATQDLDLKPGTALAAAFNVAFDVIPPMRFIKIIDQIPGALGAARTAATSLADDMRALGLLGRITVALDDAALIASDPGKIVTGVKDFLTAALKAAVDQVKFTILLVDLFGADDAAKILFPDEYAFLKGVGQSIESAFKSEVDPHLEAAKAHFAYKLSDILNVDAGPQKTAAFAQGVGGEGAGGDVAGAASKVISQKSWAGALVVGIGPVIYSQFKEELDPAFAKMNSLLRSKFDELTKAGLGDGGVDPGSAVDAGAIPAGALPMVSRGKFGWITALASVFGEDLKPALESTAEWFKTNEPTVYEAVKSWTDQTRDWVKELKEGHAEVNMLHDTLIAGREKVEDNPVTSATAAGVAGSFLFNPAGKKAMKKLWRFRAVGGGIGLMIAALSGELLPLLKEAIALVDELTGAGEEIKDIRTELTAITEDGAPKPMEEMTGSWAEYFSTIGIRGSEVIAKAVVEGLTYSLTNISGLAAGWGIAVGGIAENIWPEDWRKQYLTQFLKNMDEMDDLIDAVVPDKTIWDVITLQEELGYAKRRDQLIEQGEDLENYMGKTAMQGLVSMEDMRATGDVRAEMWQAAVEASMLGGVQTVFYQLQAETAKHWYKFNTWLNQAGIDSWNTFVNGFTGLASLQGADELGDTIRGWGQGVGQDVAGFVDGLSAQAAGGQGHLVNSFGMSQIGIALDGAWSEINLKMETGWVSILSGMKTFWLDMIGEAKAQAGVLATSVATSINERLIAPINDFLESLRNLKITIPKLEINTPLGSVLLHGGSNLNLGIDVGSINKLAVPDSTPAYRHSLPGGRDAQPGTVINVQGSIIDTQGLLDATGKTLTEADRRGMSWDTTVPDYKLAGSY